MRKILILLILTLLSVSFVSAETTRNQMGDIVDIGDSGFLSKLFSIFSIVNQGYYGGNEGFIYDGTSAGCDWSDESNCPSTAPYCRTVRQFGTLGWSSYGSCQGFMDFYGCDSVNELSGGVCSGSGGDNQVECAYDFDCDSGQACISGNCVTETATCDEGKLWCDNGQIYKCSSNHWNFIVGCGELEGKIHECSGTFGFDKYALCKENVNVCDRLDLVNYECKNKGTSNDIYICGDFAFSCTSSTMSVVGMTSREVCDIKCGTSIAKCDDGSSVYDCSTAKKGYRCRFPEQSGDSQYELSDQCDPNSDNYIGAKSKSWANFATVGDIPQDQIKDYKCTKDGGECPINSFCFYKDESQTASIYQFINSAMGGLLTEVKQLLILGVDTFKTEKVLEAGLTGFEESISPNLQTNEGICVDNQIIKDINKVANDASKLSATINDTNKKNIIAGIVANIVDKTGSISCKETVKYEDVKLSYVSEEEIEEASTNQKSDCCEVKEEGRELLFVGEKKYEELFKESMPVTLWARIGANPSVCIDIASEDKIGIEEEMDWCAWTTSFPEGFLGQCGNGYALVAIFILILFALMGKKSGGDKK